MSAAVLTSCKKEDQVAQKSIEQQKIEYQARQLEIEKQKLAIEKEKFAYEAQKRSDSIAEAKSNRQARAAAKPEVIRETKTVYVNQTPQNNGGNYANNSSNSGSGSSGTQTSTQKKGMSNWWYCWWSNGLHDWSFER